VSFNYDLTSWLSPRNVLSLSSPKLSEGVLDETKKKRKKADVFGPMQLVRIKDSRCEGRGDDRRLLEVLLPDSK
jgi:hypothetical protein